MTADPRLTLARARERLGGRVSSHGRAGEIARAAGEMGVVVWSDEASCDLWIGDDRVRRVSSGDAVAADAAGLASVAADARAFARLEEGQDVVFDESIAGRLIEKCRWGGLVARADGRIFAVGFRRFAHRTN